MSKTEEKRNFYLSYIHVSLSLPKVQMTSLLVNSVTKLWTSKINISFLHMYPSLEWKKKNQQTLVYILLMYNWHISVIFSFIKLNQLRSPPPNFIFSSHIQLLTFHEPSSLIS